jgi:hypothetical protein
VDMYDSIMTDEDFSALKKDFNRFYPEMIDKYCKKYEKLLSHVLSGKLPSEEDVEDITQSVLYEMKPIFLKNMGLPDAQKRIQIRIVARANARKVDFYRDQNQKRGHYRPHRVLEPTTLKELAEDLGAEKYDELLQLNIGKNKGKKRNKGKIKKGEIDLDDLKPGDIIYVPIKKIRLDDDGMESYPDPRPSPTAIAAEKDLWSVMKKMDYPCFYLLFKNYIEKEKLAEIARSDGWRTIVAQYGLTVPSIYLKFGKCTKLFLKELNAFQIIDDYP